MRNEEERLAHGDPVVDNDGALVYDERMDDTETGSIEWRSTGEAAAMYRRPTEAFEDGIARAATRFSGAATLRPSKGASPSMVGGKVVGGIGASGATPFRPRPQRRRDWKVLQP